MGTLLDELKRLDELNKFEFELTYFAVVYCFPSSDQQGGYSWIDSKIEFLDQRYYDNWFDLRKKGHIRSELDIFIKKDINYGIDQIEFSQKLRDEVRSKLEKLRLDALEEYNTSKRTDEDYENLQVKYRDAVKTINQEFTSLLESEFEKVEFDPSNFL